MNFKLKKKGSLIDPITYGSILLVISMTIFIGYIIWDGFSDTFTDVANTTSNNETIITSINELTTYYSWFDYMFPLLVGGFLMISLLSAYKTGSSLIFAPISLLLWAIGMILAWVYNYTFESFRLEFSSTSSIFTVVVWIMDNLIWITLVWLFLISVVMFTRNKQEDDALRSGQAAYYG